MRTNQIRRLSIYVFFVSVTVRIITFSLGYFFQLFLQDYSILYLLNYIIIFSVFFMFKKRKVIMIIGCLILIVLIGVNSLALMLDSDNKEFEFKSPNNTNTLIVEECSFLLGGWSNFYQEKYNIFKKPLINQDGITTDDGYRPFSENDYSIYWISDDKVKIEYGYGSNNIRKEVTIIIK